MLHSVHHHLPSTTSPGRSSRELLVQRYEQNCIYSCRDCQKQRETCTQVQSHKSRLIHLPVCERLQIRLAMAKWAGPSTGQQCCTFHLLFGPIDLSTAPPACLMEPFCSTFVNPDSLGGRFIIPPGLGSRRTYFHEQEVLQSSVWVRGVLGEITRNIRRRNVNGQHVNKTLNAATRRKMDAVKRFVYMINKWTNGALACTDLCRFRSNLYHRSGVCRKSICD